MKTKHVSVSVILMAVMLLCASDAYSQLGLRGGVNLSTFVGGDAVSAEEVMGLNAGLSLTLFRVGSVAIVPELYYAEKGTRFTDQIRSIQDIDPTQPGFDEPFDLRFNLSYIEVPLLLKVTLPFLSNNYMDTYIAGGPVFAWQLDCSFTISNDLQRTVEQCANDNFSDLQTTLREADRGYVISSGIDFDIPYLGIVTLDGRLVRGLSRLREDGTNTDIKNQSITLMLGYSLGF